MSSGVGLLIATGWGTLRCPLRGYGPQWIRWYAAAASVGPMATSTGQEELLRVVQVFEAWSIAVPRAFHEAFVAEGGYWHAHDESRSISLSSILLTEDDRPVPAAEILEYSADVLSGEPIETMPDGLSGRAVVAAAGPGARASRLLRGLIAADGRLLVATITADDVTWSETIWRSIRFHPAAVPSRAPRGAGARATRRRHRRARCARVGAASRSTDAGGEIVRCATIGSRENRLAAPGTRADIAQR